MKKGETYYIKAGVRLAVVFGIILICFILIMNVQIKPVEDEPIWQVVWKWSNAKAEADPGVGESGFLEIFFINHTASPATAYDENTSATLESWCVANMVGKTPYGTADEFNVELESQKSMDILVRGRGNATHAKNATIFKDNRCRVKITITCTSWADGEDISDVEGTLVVTQNVSSQEYIWYNVYWNALDNNGYQIDDDAILTVTEISMEYRF